MKKLIVLMVMAILLMAGTAGAEILQIQEDDIVIVELYKDGYGYRLGIIKDGVTEWDTKTELNYKIEHEIGSHDLTIGDVTIRFIWFSKDWVESLKEKP